MAQHLGGSHREEPETSTSEKAALFLPLEILDLVVREVYLAWRHETTGPDTLNALCQTNKAVCHTALPLLYHQVSFDFGLMLLKLKSIPAPSPLVGMKERCRGVGQGLIHELEVHLSTYMGHPQVCRASNGQAIRAWLIWAKRISRILRDLPALRVLDINLSGIHWSRQKQRREYFDDNLLLWMMVLGHGLQRGYLDKLDRIRITLRQEMRLGFEWQDEVLGKCGLWASDDLMFHLGNSIRKVEVLIACPRPGIVGESWHVRLSGPECAASANLRELRFLVGPNHLAANLPSRIGANLERLHIETSAEVCFHIPGSQMLSVLEQARGSLLELHLENILLCQGWWNDVLEAIYRIKSLRSCVLGKLTYIYDELFYLRVHEAGIGYQMSQKIPLATHITRSLSTPLISDRIEDWNSLKKLVTRGPGSVYAGGNQRDLDEWVRSHKATDLMSEAEATAFPSGRTVLTGPEQKPRRLIWRTYEYEGFEEMNSNGYEWVGQLNDDWVGPA